MKHLRRGDIWAAAGGGAYAREPRPTIVIRDGDFDSPESVTLIPMTTTQLDSPTRVLVPADGISGIDDDSYAMADEIRPHKRSTIGEYCGRLTTEQLAQVERAMFLYLGLAS